MRRLLILFALTLAGTAAAKDPPAGRPAFDPSLLTRTPETGLMAFRPAELVANFGAPDETVSGVVTQLAKAATAFIDGELKAEDLPPVADIEQLVLGLNLNLKLSTDEEQGTFGVQGTDFGYVRTKGKFDWAGLIKKTFPKAETKKHAGREYLTAGIKFGTFEFVIGFYVPDERTLVFDVSTEKMEEALATWGEKKAPKMATGWDEVKGCSMAFVMPMGDRKWMTTPAGKLPEYSKQVRTLVKSLKSVCVGVTLGDTITAVGVLTATSDKAAHAVEGTVNQGLTAYEAELDEAFKDTMNATTTRDGKTVRVNGVVKVSSIKDLFVTKQNGLTAPEPKQSPAGEPKK